MKGSSYFRSSGYLDKNTILAESGYVLDLRKLPAFLRTLMVTDGTVTKSLEAWFWEPVDVEVISNNLLVLNDTVAGLEVQIGDKVLQRQVALKGKNTKRLFACASSTVSLKHLPPEVVAALEQGKMGIGELLREKGVETYRDIFNINFFSGNENSKNKPEITAEMQHDIVSRSYRIRVNHHPAIIVTEYFSLPTYSADPD